MRSKGKKGDGAITDYYLAKEFGWTFEDIDNADPIRMQELLVVIETKRKIRNEDNRKKNRKKKRGR